jgi:hypothetical protein
VWEPFFHRDRLRRIRTRPHPPGFLSPLPTQIPLTCGVGQVRSCIPSLHSWRQAIWPQRSEFRLDENGSKSPTPAGRVGYILHLFPSPEGNFGSWNRLRRPRRWSQRPLTRLSRRLSIFNLPKHECRPSHPLRRWKSLNLQTRIAGLPFWAPLEFSSSVWASLAASVCSCRTCGRSKFRSLCFIKQR